MFKYFKCFAELEKCIRQRERNITLDSMEELAAETPDLQPPSFANISLFRWNSSFVTVIITAATRGHSLTRNMGNKDLLSQLTSVVLTAWIQPIKKRLLPWEHKGFVHLVYNSSSVSADRL